MPLSSPVLRRVTAVLATATAIATLSACAGETPQASPGEDESGTNVVSTLYGDVSVPAGAERVVALNFPEATALVDLGVTPIGHGGYEPDFPAYNTAFADVPVVTDSAGTPDLEKIAALEPDLIVTDAFATDVEKFRATYDKLTSIAPTVVLEWTQAAGNWPADAAGTAAAIGKTEELDELKADYEKKAADIKTTYADVLSSHTIDLISGNASAWYLYGPSSSHGQVLADAGAVLSAAADQQDGFVEYSPEQLDMIKDTGILFVADDSLEQLQTLPTFSGLAAAQANTVFTTSHFFPSSYGIAGALLDDFTDALEKVE